MLFSKYEIAKLNFSAHIDFPKIVGSWINSTKWSNLLLPNNNLYHIIFWDINEEGEVFHTQK